ncbi:hypothetical protein C6A85_14350, partial [Mycobacterium sp. ITM-2017-0098]
MDLVEGAPTTLTVADGPDGPTLTQARDMAGGAAPLDAPALSMPAVTAAPVKDHAKSAAPIEVRPRLYLVT